MVDETDVGLYPSLSEIDMDGEMVKCLISLCLWAVEANKRPTIIHFEELNRASQQVRNAALQILLEREIGTAFKFNDNVLMMSSGNLGDEDGTDVEEFDSALNNRLIHINHTLDVQEWLEIMQKKIVTQ
jgi:MoxR-like ATPase